MSYWSHNPELLDEITTKNLPEPYQTAVVEGEMELSDVPDDILGPAMDVGVSDHWADVADAARMRAKDIDRGEEFDKAIEKIGKGLGEHLNDLNPFVKPVSDDDKIDPI